jgi:hypothetical protein
MQSQRYNPLAVAEFLDRVFLLAHARYETSLFLYKLQALKMSILFGCGFATDLYKKEENSPLEAPTLVVGVLNFPLVDVSVRLRGDTSCLF